MSQYKYEPLILHSPNLQAPCSSSMASTLLSFSPSNKVSASFNVPKHPKISNTSIPIIPSKKLFEELNGFSHANTFPLFENNVITKQLQNDSQISFSNSKTTVQLYSILEAIADRVEMHHNIGEQRNNWNTLLLNSINMITLTASTMAGVAAVGSSGVPLLALKLSSALLFSAATGLLLVMNRIQPSQLAEEQRNATRLFKQLQTHIETKIALRNATQEDVKDVMEKVLALDKAFPLPLLGARIDKFPAKFEPEVWWPSSQSENKFQEKKVDRKMATEKKKKKNGWSEELETELKNVIEVVRRKDVEDYERLGNLVLKVNKTLAIAGPLLTGIAAVGSAFVSQGSWAAMVPALAGTLATAVNAFEHGGQVGMVSEMYRNCAGFFQMLENSIKETIEEDIEERENGEMFEMNVALKLGRSLSQLKELARKSAYCRIEGSAIDEFASKLF